ncbi:hypothetical protein ABLO27_17475 [Roseibium sp. SCPC15]|uniref:hypothetical protein n=1 Tax=Roseibium sp. SCP15 TaxID=3141376 RepID=UPI0033388028
MTTYPHSLVVIAPAAMVPAASAMAAALGLTAGFAVPLSVSGVDPATHYGLHSWVAAAFKAYMTGEQVPDLQGYTAVDIAALLGQLTVSVDAGGQTGRTHFEAVTGGLGLSVIVPLDELPQES